MEFAQNLKFLMETEGLTKYRLAKEINISQTSLANWLEEKNIPHPSTLNILASYFGISVDELVGEKLPPVAFVLTKTLYLVRVRSPAARTCVPEQSLSG